MNGNGNPTEHAAAPEAPDARQCRARSAAPRGGRAPRSVSAGRRRARQLPQAQRAGGRRGAQVRRRAARAGDSAGSRQSRGGTGGRGESRSDGAARRAASHAAAARRGVDRLRHPRDQPRRRAFRPEQARGAEPRAGAGRRARTRCSRSCKRATSSTSGFCGPPKSSWRGERVLELRRTGAPSRGVEFFHFT